MTLILFRSWSHCSCLCIWGMNIWSICYYGNATVFHVCSCLLKSICLKGINITLVPVCIDFNVFGLDMVTKWLWRDKHHGHTQHMQTERGLHKLYEINFSINGCEKQSKVCVIYVLYSRHCWIWRVMDVPESCFIYHRSFHRRCYI